MLVDKQAAPGIFWNSPRGVMVIFNLQIYKKVTDSIRGDYDGCLFGHMGALSTRGSRMRELSPENRLMMQAGIQPTCPHPRVWLKEEA